jgi:hypothetical protein
MTEQLTISIDTWGDGITSYPAEIVEGLPSMLAQLGGEGASVTVGGLTGGVGAMFTVEAEGWGQDGPLIEAVRRGVVVFSEACEKLGLEHGGIARVEVVSEAYLELELDQRSERYLGVKEVAQLLGVSPQRVSELRATQAFPAPIAELAAGPVWKERALRRFIDTWDRRPGRPRRVKEASGT